MNVPAKVPEPRQAAYQALTDLGVAIIGQTPGECTTTVVELHIQPLEPRGAMRSGQLPFGFFRQVEEDLRMLCTNLIRFSACFQPVECVRTDCFEQTKTRFAGFVRADLDETLIDERGQSVKKRETRFSLGAHLLRGVQCPATREHAQPTKQAL